MEGSCNIKRIQTWVGFPHLSFIDTDTWILIETSHVVGICQDEVVLQQKEGQTLLWTEFLEWQAVAGAFLISCHHGNDPGGLGGSSCLFTMSGTQKTYNILCFLTLSVKRVYYFLHSGSCNPFTEPQLWWGMAI